MREIERVAEKETVNASRAEEKVSSKFQSGITCTLKVTEAASQYKEKSCLLFPQLLEKWVIPEVRIDFGEKQAS